MFLSVFRYSIFHYSIARCSLTFSPQISYNKYEKKICGGLWKQRHILISLIILVLVVVYLTFTLNKTVYL